MTTSERFKALEARVDLVMEAIVRLGPWVKMADLELKRLGSALVPIVQQAGPLIEEIRKALESLQAIDERARWDEGPEAWKTSEPE